MPSPIERASVPITGGTQEIRFFSDTNLQTSIDKALAGVTAKSAVLSLEKNPTGFNAAIAANLNGHWSIVAGYSKSEWGSSLGTKVKFTW